MKRWLFGLVVFGLPWSCSVTESPNVETSGIWANFLLRQADEPGKLVCLGVLRVGGPTGTIVDLSGGEYLSCDGVRMTEYYEAVTNFHWSRAVVDETPDGRHEIVFHRQDEVVVTRLQMPAVPVILSVGPEGTALRCGVPNPIEWEASAPADEVDISIEADCLEPIRVTGTEDDGEYVLQAEEVVNNGQSESCDATVRVTRTARQDVNPAFQGGHASAESWDATQVPATAPLP